MSSAWGCEKCGAEFFGDYHKCNPDKADAYHKQKYINEQYRKNPTEMMRKDIANMHEETRQLRSELSKK